MGTKVIRLPGPKKIRWYKSETSRAIAETLLAVVGAVSVVIKSRASDESAGVLYLAFAVLSLIAVIGVLRLIAARSKDRENNDRDEPHHLLAPLRVLYNLVAIRKSLGTDDASKLRFRVTLHRVVPGEDLHEQIVPYVGGKTRDAKDVVGRRWTNHCGLVGKVVRQNRPDPQQTCLSENVDNHDKYVAELIDLYGYRDDQARMLQSMRLDALAIPLMSAEKVIAVVYADSSERNFFDQETVELCVQISTAIVQHIESTYLG